MGPQAQEPANMRQIHFTNEDFDRIRIGDYFDITWTDAVDSVDLSLRTEDSEQSFVESLGSGYLGHPRSLSLPFNTDYHFHSKIDG